MLAAFRFSKHPALPLILLPLLVHAAQAQMAAHVVVEDIWIHDVPGPPQGDFWDPIIANLFSVLANAGTIYPDVKTCAKSSAGATTCAELCPDFQGDAKRAPTPSEECRRPFELALPPNDPQLLLQLIEVDPNQQRVIITLTVKNPERCLHDQPCRIDTPKGPLVVSFGTVVQGTAGVLAPPVAQVPAPAEPETNLKEVAATAWEWTKDKSGKVWKWFTDYNDPTGDARETAERAAKASQMQVNQCLATVAHDHGLGSRMPLCAQSKGKEFEECVFNSVLSESADAIGAGISCRGFAQAQRDIDNVGKSAAHVWLCNWWGVNVCGDK